MNLHYPLSTKTITQHFGERPEVYKPDLGHMGIDFRTKSASNPEGRVGVMAAASGIVELGNQATKGYGKFVRLHHADGSETIYGHLSEWKVQENEHVEAGQVIGIAGNTGFSSAPHLHFGYRPPHFDIHNGFGGYVDPLPLLMPFSIPYFEQKIGQTIICYLDSNTQTLVPFDSGEVFKDLFGSYEAVKVNQVAEWSFPLSTKLLGLYEKN